jgi:excisionase family DNA binding protein
VFLTISRKEAAMAGHPKKRQQAPAPATTTIVEAAKRLRIGRNQAYEAAHRGDIPTIRIGKRWLVPTGALDRLLSGEVTKRQTKSA